ncbi:MAG TPA: hypothetical protein VE890_04105, partial [Thermoguttaceae bacterium]|nr:hypothetical protein [Thermoguttaceae bacterium]
MKIFRRLTLLGLFGTIGVAMAVSVAISTTDTAANIATKTAADTDIAVPHASAPTPRPADLPSEPQEVEPPRLRQPSSVPTVSVLAKPPLEIPSGPLVAAPYPPRTQQFLLSQSDTSRLPSAMQFMQRQLGLRSSPEPVAAPPSNVAPPSTVTPPAATPPPAAAIDTEPLIESEGDGNLKILFQDDDLTEVLSLLAEHASLNILASSSVQGKVSATLNGVDINQALDAVLKSTQFTTRRDGDILFVGTDADFEAMEHILDQTGTRVYRPNYVTAAELQALIQPMLTEEVGAISVSSPAETGIATNDTAVGGDDLAVGDVILVRDYEAVLAAIDQVVEEIDTRPMQVAIEAMILSVNLNDGNDFGVNFEILRDNDNAKLGWGVMPEATASNRFDTVDVVKTLAVDGLTRVALGGGLKFGYLDQSLGAFLDALETIGDTNVIATPRVLVLNKQPAEIQIGAENGYVSTTQTETSTTQSVEFLKTGTVLRLRPFIATDGLIRMEIHPELSSGSVEVKDGFTLPNKEVTQVTTNIMIRDGCTAVIGGLIREELETTTSQVPLFGSLPLIGVAFRNKSETIERQEVIVLITPRIVYEPASSLEGNEVACEVRRRQAVYA